MDYSNIPEEMRGLDQWVCCWNTSKIPMRPFEYKSASSTAPETWGSFEQATAAVEAGYYDNIGFVFADNGLVGIDIDVGFEDRLLTELGVDIINACRSYTEKSRSGRGVHIILRGNLPFEGKNNLQGVEIYKAGRYFITTGKVLLHRQIIENQAAIDYVVDKYFKAVDNPVEKGGKWGQRIYNPVFPPPGEKKVYVRPVYPVIERGGRNLSLASLAGLMHNVGFSKGQIYEELQYVNRECCKPPLRDRELQGICESITRYRR